jgi:hypothetical protein
VFLVELGSQPEAAWTSHGQAEIRSDRRRSIARRLILTDNAAGGGTCFGDSGGPNFVGSSTIIAGVNSYVINTQCAGTSGVYRIDKADDVDWLATFFD